MLPILTNWKTSLTGAAAIFGALATLSSDAANGTIDPAHLGLAFTAIASGLGLIAAQDAKKNPTT